MSLSVDVNVRIPRSVDAQLESLTTELRAHPAYAPYRLTKAAVVRMAMARGIEVLRASAIAEASPIPPGKE